LKAVSAASANPFHAFVTPHKVACSVATAWAWCAAMAKNGMAIRLRPSVAAPRATPAVLAAKPVPTNPPMDRAAPVPTRAYFNKSPAAPVPGGFVGDPQSPSFDLQ